METYDPTEWQRQAAGMIAPTGQKASQTNLESSLIDLVKRHLTGSLLEVACIDGRYYEWLGRPAQYVGVDITPKFLERARLDNPTGDFRIGDARALEFPDDSFDTVLSGNLLMHLPDLSAMDELFRVAKKTVIFSAYGNEPEVRTTHGFGFLNFWRPWREFKEKIPTGWHVAERITIQPSWDTNVILYLAAIAHD